VRGFEMPVTIDEMNRVTSLPLVQGAFCQVPHLQKQPYVYFVQNEDGFVKIGTTRHVKSRLVRMQIDNCMKIKLIGKMKGGFDLEAELHKRFKKYRKRGEWFHPAPELIEYILNNKMYGRKV